MMLFSFPFTLLNKCQLNKSAIYKKEPLSICNFESKAPAAALKRKLSAQSFFPFSHSSESSCCLQQINFEFIYKKNNKKICEKTLYVEIINCFIFNSKAAITFEQEESREV